VTGLNKAEDGFPTTRADLVQAEEERQVRKVENAIDDIVTFEEYLMDDADVAVVAFGSIARSARYAVNEARKAGIRAGLFRIITYWPFPERQIRAIAERVKAIITPEMNLGMTIHEVRRCVEGRAPVSGIFRVDGEPIGPGEIFAALREVR